MIRTHVARRGPVVVARLDVDEIGEGIELLSRELAEATSEHRGSARLLLSVQGKLALPDKPHRSRMQALLRHHAPDLGGIALVLVGRPFWVAAARSGIAVVFSDLKRQTSVEVFDAPDDGTAFIAVGDAAVREWVEGQLRASPRPE